MCRRTFFSTNGWPFSAIHGSPEDDSSASTILTMTGGLLLDAEHAGCDAGNARKCSRTRSRSKKPGSIQVHHRCHSFIVGNPGKALSA
jgi:hypothetical protein